MLSLANDNPATGSQVVTFGGGSQQNSQCIVNGAGSSVSSRGQHLDSQYFADFPAWIRWCEDYVYLYAADAGANTGWVSRGAWTVVIPPPQPSADSVSPNGSSGGSQTFTFVFSDSQSATNLIGMAMLFNTTSATVTNACDIVYDRNAGTVALTWDSGAGSDPKALGSPVVLKNSQCQVGAVTAAASGLSQIITLSITFTAAFSGTKNIYMYRFRRRAEHRLGAARNLPGGGRWTAGGEFGGSQPRLGSGTALQLHGFRSRRLRLHHRHGHAAVFLAQHHQRLQHGLRPHAQRGVAGLR